MSGREQIEADLSEAQRAFLADLEAGQGFFKQLGAVFKGPMGWVGISVLVAAFAMVGLAIWFGWEAFHAPNDRLTTLWAAGAIAAILGNGLLRLFLMGRMHQLTLLRAIKQVELRLKKLEEQP